MRKNLTNVACWWRPGEGGSWGPAPGGRSSSLLPLEVEGCSLPRHLGLPPPQLPAMGYLTPCQGQSQPSIRCASLRCGTALRFGPNVHVVWFLYDRVPSPCPSLKPSSQLVYLIVNGKSAFASKKNEKDGNLRKLTGNMRTSSLSEGENPGWPFGSELQIRLWLWRENTGELSNCAIFEPLT